MQENTKIIEYNYKVYELMFVYYKQTHNYESQYKGPYKNLQTWTSGTLTLLMGSFQDR